MTICAAWTRRVGPNVEELVFASDSRLSGGGRTINHSPKILPLPRGDCAIAFDGEIDLAYPLLLQAAQSIEAYRRSLTRALGISELRSHLIRMLTRLVAGMGDTIPDTELPRVSFLFGGYSWIQKQFKLWTFRYNPGLRVFAAVPARHFKDVAVYAFTGDMAGEARRRFITLTQNRYGLELMTDRLNMEPLEVIRDMLRESRYHTIGGSPQLAKVYQHMNATAFGVFWPDLASGRVTLNGRDVFEFEDIDKWVIDPDGLRSFHLSFTPAEKFSQAIRGSAD